MRSSKGSRSAPLRLGLTRLFCLTFEVDFFTRRGFAPIGEQIVDADVYSQLVRSPDEGVAEFLDLAHVKPNTLGNTRMLKELSIGRRELVLGAPSAHRAHAGLAWAYGDRRSDAPQAALTRRIPASATWSLLLGLLLVVALVVWLLVAQPWSGTAAESSDSVSGLPRPRRAGGHGHAGPRR